MSHPECTVCGHVSRLGAHVCEACDARFDAHGRAAAAAGPARTGEGQFRSYAGRNWPAEGPPAPRGAGSVAAGEIPPQPFGGAGDVFAPTLEVYRKNFVLVGALVLVTMMPVALLQYGVVQAATEGVVAVSGGGWFTPGVLTPLLLNLLSVVGAALLSASLVYGVVDLQRSGRASAAACLRRGLGALPTAFVITILYTLVTLVGYVLLIVPGVVFSLMYAVSVPVAAVEGRGPLASMKRSAELTRGLKGLIFLTYFLWWLLVFALNWFVGWSFTHAGAAGQLPYFLLQAAVTGMLTSSTYVLTAYVYLGLLDERRRGSETRAFAPGPEAAAR